MEQVSQMSLGKQAKWTCTNLWFYMPVAHDRRSATAANGIIGDTKKKLNGAWCGSVYAGDMVCAWPLDQMLGVVKTSLPEVVESRDLQDKSLNYIRNLQSNRRSWHNGTLKTITVDGQPISDGDGRDMFSKCQSVEACTAHTSTCAHLARLQGWRGDKWLGRFLTADLHAHVTKQLLCS